MTYFLPEKIRVDIGPSVQVKDLFGATHTVKRFAVVSSSFSGEEMPNLAIDEVVILDVQKDYAIVKVGGEYMMDFPLSEIARAACHGRVHRNLILGPWVWVLHAGRYSLRHESDLPRLGVKEIKPKKPVQSRPGLERTELVIGGRYRFGSMCGFYLGFVKLTVDWDVNPSSSFTYDIPVWAYETPGGTQLVELSRWRPIKISPALAKGAVPDVSDLSRVYYNGFKVISAKWDHPKAREIVAKQEAARA